MPIHDLGLENVSLAFATKTIFSGVTQGVFEGDRIGIVGANGDGKSTLLQVLQGSQEIDSGRVVRRNGISFGLLSQYDSLDDNATVRQAALENREDYEWAADTKTREIVEVLLGGINLDTTVASLSGGQRRRADLARLLLHDWDILALDEPTNHLDIITIHWLAEHLKSRWSSDQGALLVVTHDRWFLDEVCESMWEVHDGQIDPFEGGYSAYMLQRVERERQANIREERRRNLARKELAWLTRGARARSTKQKFHVKQAKELIADVPEVRNSLELKQMATSRLGKQVVDLVDVTQIFYDPHSVAGYQDNNQIQVVPSMYPQPRLQASADIAVDSMQDSRLVSSGFNDENVQILSDNSSNCDVHAAKKIRVQGHAVLADVTWLIGPGDRIGIVGANGAGKSTLLEIIQGKLMPTLGHVTIGKTVKFALLSQRLTELEALGKYRIQEVLSRYKNSYIVDGKEVTPGQLMERLGFSAAQLMTRIQDLSGGQKRRMQLLLILLDEPNVLIMDEPGNDLDTDMLAVMEDLLDTWPGTLIIVSHDRYLLERVTDDQYALFDGKIRHLPGGIDDYIAMVERYMRQHEDSADSSNNTNNDAAEDNTSPALSGKEFHEISKRVAAIERKLAKLKSDMQNIEQQMAQEDPSDFVALQALNEQLSAMSDESESLEEEWMELSEKIE
ncbi:MAG: ABC-F family ATP-binding cassette domain-containing protein [Bifidobacteriaceae bacterium]|nr:ABC-F family ATP-binding cassette domain-containing protein [Bifidobacteriaceae bacterium]